MDVLQVQREAAKQEKYQEKQPGDGVRHNQAPPNGSHQSEERDTQLRPRTAGE